MAKTDHKASIRKKNEVAQLQVLSLDLKEVTAALSENTKRNSELIKSNEALEAEKAAVLKEIETIKKDASEMMTVAQSRMDLAKKEEEYLKRLQIESQEALSQIAREQDGIVQASRSIVLSKVNELNSLNEEISQKKDELASIDLNIKTSLAAFEIEKKEHFEKLSTMSSEIEKEWKLLSSLERDVNGLSIQLQELECLVRAEQAKIELPAKSIKEQEKQLAKKKKDLDIYASRIAARFRIAFPGQEIKI